MSGGVALNPSKQDRTHSAGSESQLLDSIDLLIENRFWLIDRIELLGGFSQQRFDDSEVRRIG
jgi:hypothetical protein